MHVSARILCLQFLTTARHSQSQVPICRRLPKITSALFEIGAFAALLIAGFTEYLAQVCRHLWKDFGVGLEVLVKIVERVYDSQAASVELTRVSAHDDGEEVASDQVHDLGRKGYRVLRHIFSE